MGARFRAAYVCALLALACGRNLEVPPSGAPSVGAVEPAAAFAQQTVALRGSSLGGEKPEVWFGPVRGVVESVADDVLRVTVPIGARDGAIEVRNSRGTASSPPFHYRGGGELELLRIAETFRLPSRMISIAVASDGRLAVARDDGTAVVTSLIDDRWTTLHGVGVGFDATGRVVDLVPGGGLNRFFTSDAGVVGGYDTTVMLTGRPQRMRVADNGAIACVGLTDPPAVARVDLGSLAVQTVPLPEEPGEVLPAADGAACWVALAQARSVATVTAVATTVLGSLVSAPRGLAASADGHWLFVTEERGVLHRVDLRATGDSLVALPAAASAIALSADGATTYVALAGGLLARVVTDPPRLEGTFAAGGEVTALAVKGGAVLVGDAQSGALLWLDAASGAELRRSFRTAPTGGATAVDPISGRVYYGAAPQAALGSFDPAVGAFSVEPTAFCPSYSGLSTSPKGWLAATFVYANGTGVLCLSRPGVWPQGRIARPSWTARLGETAIDDVVDAVFVIAPDYDQVLWVKLEPFAGFDGTKYPDSKTYNFVLFGPKLNRPEHLALSEDGATLVVAEASPPALVTAHVAASGAELRGRVLLERPVDQVAVLPDGSAAFVTSFLKPGTGLWRVPLPDGPPQQLDGLFPSASRPWSLSVSPNGRVVYVGGTGSGSAGLPGFIGAVASSDGTPFAQISLRGLVAGLASDATGESLWGITQAEGGELVRLR